MTKEIPGMSEVYFDRGPIAVRGRPVWTRGFRFMHQLFLGWEFPDIVPQLAIPANPIPEGRFPVQKINGPGWEKVLKYNIPFAVQIEIAKEATNQLRYIYSTSGILLDDRHYSNIMLSKSSTPTNILFHGNYWRVWQVDLGWVYDSCKDSYTISYDVRLPRKLRIKNKAQTGETIAIICRRMIENLLEARHISENMKDRLYEFFVLSYRDQTFDTLANFLDGLTA